MKKSRIATLALLAIGLACSGDTPTSAGTSVLPSARPRLHVAGESGPNDAHPDLAPTSITAPIGVNPEPVGSVTLSWNAAQDADVEEYRYRIECLGAGCTPVSAKVTTARSGSAKLATVSVSENLTAGQYVLWVRGEKTNGSGLHGSPYRVRTFTVSELPPSDQTPPSVNCTVPNDELWYANDVTVNCTAQDTGSGLQTPGDALFQLTTSVNAGVETSSAMTGTKTITDNAGNSVTVGPYGPFRIDRKAPTYSCPVTQDQTSWYGADQSVACTSVDGGSGLALADDVNFTLTTNVGAGFENSNAATGSKAITDAVGNSVTAGPISGFKIDIKGPALACDQTPFKFLLNQNPATVSATITDGGSGPKVTSTSAAASTGSAGLKSVMLSGEDIVGNASQQSCSYTVEYNFGSWGPYLLQPINRPNEKLSSFKLGSTVPAKFVLLDANGIVVQSSVVPTVKIAKLSLTNGDLADGIEQEVVSTSAATTGNNFRWDDTQYIYNISTKTPTGFWATGYLYKVTATIVENGLTTTVTGEFAINK
jgi:hypothetical protein